jgi:hypothetical protein
MGPEMAAEGNGGSHLGSDERSSHRTAMEHPFLLILRSEGKARASKDGLR